MNKIDVTSANWKILKRDIQERIAELQQDLEVQMEETRTAHIRGAIAELRRFLQKHDPAPVKEAEEITGEGSIYS